MPAAYDNYDYPAYWKGRDYEHLSEYLAIKYLLHKVPKINRMIEIGAGYGRLFPAYQFRAKKIILSDPSAKLMKIARNKYSKNKKVEFLQSKLENLKNRKRSGTFDLTIMVRVLHHIDDIDSAFEIVSSLLNNGGYFILEFPNKNHLKATFKKIFQGDLTYPINIFPIDIRSKRNVSGKTLPFRNYHPDFIFEKLKTAGFEVVDVRSVSNIRSSFIKKLFPLNTLLDLEKSLQVAFAHLYFGPSLFVLARKRGN